MKALHISVLIFALFLGANVYLYCYLNRTTETILEKAGSAQMLLEEGDYGALLDSLRQLKEETDRYQKVWQVMTNHGEIDKIQSSLILCIGFAETQDEKNTLANLYSLQFNLKNLTEREKINLSNLF